VAENSEFFDKMFKTNMKEKNKGHAILQDVNSAVLEEIIKFIYTGKVDISDSDKATEVLDAAEQFGLMGLKAICVEQLLKKIDNENALKMLKTADMYNLEELEIQSLKIIMR
jgi:hypothetical protein